MNVRAFPCRPSGSQAILGMLLLSPLGLLAQVAPTTLPTNPSVTHGAAGIQTDGAAMAVTQDSDKLVVDWDTFSIGESASVDFLQPSADAFALNRVLGDEVSSIFGRLQANGRIALINPKGILFGEGARVEVGALVASTLDIADSAFLVDDFTFSGATGFIQNNGELLATAGSIALLSPQVRNNGFVQARLGTVALGSGSVVSLEFKDAGGIAMRVDEEVLSDLADSGEALMDATGNLILSTNAANSLAEQSMNGVTPAAGGLVIGADGQPRLVLNTGRVDAAAVAIDAGDAGSVEQLGDVVSQSGASGGLITLEGESIFLGSESSMDASGANGGGAVLVGGDWQGGANAERRVFDDPDALRQATTVTMESGASIDASATDKGDGGTVVLWSDITNAESVTEVHGEIVAMGGANGGDGGQVETSGRTLILEGTDVSTAAALGRTGDWLLDPGNITISDAGTDTLGASSFEASTTTALSTLSVESGLASNNVTISTGTGAYDLTVQDDLAWTSGNKLTLIAGRYMRLWGNIDSSIGGGSVEFQAGAGLSAADVGNVRFSTGAGDISFVSDWIAFDGGLTSARSDTTTIATTGTLSIVPFNNNFSAETLGGSDGATGSALEWSGTLSGGNFTSGYDFKNLIVEDYANLGGLVLGKSGSTTTVYIGDDISIAGPISIYGGSVNLRANLQTTASAAEILLKASGNVTVAASKSIITNAGDITLWANTDDAGGVILLNDDVTLDSRSNADRTALNTSTATGGGSITLGGGSVGSTEPTGFALNASTSAIHQAGIQLGTYSHSAKNANISIYSGGGNIGLRGKSTAAGNKGDSTGILGWEGITVNAGDVGSIALVGESSAGSYSDGINLGAFAGNASSPAASNWQTKDGDITLSGTASGGSTVSRGTLLWAKSTTTPNAFVITGSGTLSLTGNGTNYDVVLGGVNLLALSGSIALNGEGDGSTITGGQGVNTIGYLSGSAVTASTSQITVSDNEFSLTSGSGFAFNTASTVTLQPYSDDFGGAVTLTYLNLSADVTGLTIGKAPSGADGTSDATVTLDSPISIDGLITIYAGDIAIDATLAASDGAGTPTLSDINLHASGAVTQSAAITADGLGLHGTGTFTLTNSVNAVNTLAGGDGTTKLGSLSYVDSDALIIGSVNPTGITASGSVSIETVSGDLSVTESISTTDDTASAVVLNAGSGAAAGTASGGDLLITAGKTITVGTGGFAKLYSGSVSGSTGLTDLVGLGSGNFRYNSDEFSTNFTKPLVAGISGIYREQPSVVISSATLSMTYGDAIPGLPATGLINGDGAGGLEITGRVDSTSGNISTSGSPYTISTDAVTLGYAVSGATTGTLTVNPKSLPVTGSTVVDKVYDGSAAATVSDSIVTPILGDVVSLQSGTNAFVDENVGTAKAVTTNFTITGADADNYSLVQPSGLSGDITAAPLTLSATKTYDGTLDLTGAVSFFGLIGTETLNYTGATSSDAHVATSGNFISAITLEDGTNGGLATNYQLPTLNVTNAPVTINPATLTPTLSNSGVSKIYDGTTDAPAGFVPTYTFAGLVTGDSDAVLGNTAAAYDDKDVLDATKVTVSGLSISSISGNNSSAATDYVLDATSKDVSAAITPATVSLSASKTYNGTTSLTGAVILVTGVGSETLTYIGATANDAHVATANKFINAITLTDASDASGGLASNYQVPTLDVANAPVTINPATLTPTLSSSGVTKVYDGSIGAPAGFVPTYTFVGLVTGDSDAVLANTSAAYDDKDVLDATKVTVSGLSISSISGTNSSAATDYVLDATSKDVSAAITPATVSLSATKTYDGTTSLNGAVTLNTGVGSETLTYTGAIANDTHVATANKFINAITLTDASDASGGLASNYQLPTLDVANAPVTINPATLTPTLSNSGVTKIYDGTTDAPAGFVPTYTFVGLVTGDTDAVISNTALAYDDKDVLDATKVTVSGLSISSISGTNSSAASDYVLDATGKDVSAAITPATVSLSASKTYDGTTSLAGAVTLTTGVGSETLTYTGATANDAHVATANKFINAITLTDASDASGGLASNYQVPTLNVANAAVTINPATLTPTLSNSGVTKVYDGSIDAPAGFVPTYTFAGLVTGDSDAVLGNTAAAYDDKDVLDATKVTVSGLSISSISGTNSSAASDYVLDATSKDVSAAITPATVSLSASKTYDGTTNLTGAVTLTAGVGSETLTYTGATANDAHVATANKFINAITLTDASDASGGLASNYQVPTLDVANASVTINPATLTPTLSNSGVTKVYDGSTDAPAGFVPTYTFAGLVTGDSDAVLGNTAAAYDDKDVLDATKVTVSGLSISSISGTNSSAATDYVLDATSKDVSAAITPATLTVTYSAADKTYDGTTGVDVTDADDRVSGDLFAVTESAAFVDKNVGTGKTVNVVSINISGPDAPNYVLATTTYQTSADISRLASVTWNGDGDGVNWFDPANWEVTGNPAITGVVPDLSNVSVVQIPEGAHVIFDETALSGTTQAGTVQIASLTFVDQGNLASSQFELQDGDLVVSNSATFGVLVGSSGTSLDVGSSLSVDIPSGTSVFAGLLKGTGTLSKAGAGTFSLAQANTFTGNVSVQDGILQAGTSSSAPFVSGPFGLGSALVSGTGAVDLNGQAVNNAVSLTGTGYNASGAVFNSSSSAATLGGVVTLAGDTTLKAGAGAVTLSSTVDGAHVLTLDNTATFILNGLVGDSTALASFSSNGPLALNADVSTSGNQSYSGTNTLADGLTLTATSGSISGGATDAHNLTVQASSGNVTFTNASNTFSGTFAVQAQGVSLVNFDGLDVAITAAANSTIQTGGDLSIAGTVSGNASDLTIEAGSGISLGTISVDGAMQVTTFGDGALGGVRQTGALTVGGDATFVAASGAAQVAQMGTLANDLKGAVSFTSANSGSWATVAVNDTNDLAFDNVSASGNLAATAANDLSISGTVSVGSLDLAASTGAISQDSSTTVNVTTGPSMLSAGTDITLDQANDFGGLLTASGASVTLRDGNAMSLNLIATGSASVTTGGNLTLAGAAVGQDASFNSGGSLSQTAALAISGSTAISATDGTTPQMVMLTNSGNDFAGGVGVTGSSVAITDANAILLNAVVASGDLTVRTGMGGVSGGLSQAASTSVAIINVAGTARFYADEVANQDVDLSTQDNTFGGPVLFLSGANTGSWDSVRLKQTGDFELGDITTSGDYALLLTGALTNAVNATVSIGGAAEFAGSSITLGNQTGDDIAFGTIAFTSTGAVVIEEDGPMEIASVPGNVASSAGNLSLSALGEITDGTSAKLVVTGSTTLWANTGNADAQIVLDNNNHQFGGAVSATGSNITLTDIDALEFDTIIASGDLVTHTGSANGTGSGNGGLSQTGTIVVAGNSIFNADSVAGQNAALGNANDFVGTVSFVNIAGGSWNNILINDVNDLELGDVTASGNLDATAADDLTLSGDISADTLDLTATAGSITQGPDSSLTVATGPSDLTAGVNITLSGVNDLTGPVSATAVDVSVQAVNSLDITVVASGNTNLQVDGDLTANLTVGGTSELTTTGGGALSVDGTTQNLVIRGSGSTRVGQVEVEGELDVESQGALDDEQGLTGNVHVDKAVATDPTTVSPDSVGDSANTFASSAETRESNGMVFFTSIQSDSTSGLSTGLTLALDGNATLTGVQTGGLGVQVGFDSVTVDYLPSIAEGIGAPTAVVTSVIELGEDGSVVGESSFNVTDAFGEIIVEVGAFSGGGRFSTAESPVLDSTTLVMLADDGTQLVFRLELTGDGLNILPSNETSGQVLSRNMETIVALSIAQVRQDLKIKVEAIQQIVIKPASVPFSLPPTGVALASKTGP